jgi:5-methylcytosine-specific restriction endonuclease McrA
LRQRVLFCRCGSSSIYVRGLCQRCYHRERADRNHFAGLREQVLKRDQHRCRGCQAGSIDTALAVHHRQPGSSSLELLVTLCPACHAVVERTQVLFRDVPELLRVLWRELHPAASEQMPLFAS